MQSDKQQTIRSTPYARPDRHRQSPHVTYQRGDTEDNPAPLPISAGRQDHRDRVGQTSRGHQERHGQRAFLPGAFPRLSRHARRAHDRGNSAGGGGGRAGDAGEQGQDGLLRGHRRGALQAPSRAG